MRVLLLMTTRTYRASAFLDAARTLGMEVVVGSDRRQALEHANPSGHLTLDFDDPARATDAIAEYAARRPLDAVIAADDEGAEIAARAAERLALRHAAPRAVAATRDKGLLREILQGAGAPSPWFRVAPVTADPFTLAALVDYPCVIKPTSLSASRGVIRADDHASFVAAFRRSAAVARAGAAQDPGPPRLVIEQFLPGRELALEGLVTRGKLRVLAVFDKPDPLLGPIFEETLYVTPSRLDPAALEAVIRGAQHALESLGLDHGPVHAELRWDGTQAMVVEIAARSIGGLCSRALRFTGGATLEQVLLRHAVGEALDGVEREAAASGVMMIPIPAAGRLEAVQGLEEARAVPGIVELRMTIPIGDRLVPLPEGARYLGFIFARAGDPDQVEMALRAAHGALRFEIRDSPGAILAGDRRGGFTS